MPSASGRSRVDVPAARRCVVRGGRVVSHDVPDRLHPAAPAGARARRPRPCSCTPARAASAPQRSSSRSELGATVIATASSRREARVRARRRVPTRRVGYDEIDDLRVDVVVDPVGGETFTRSLPLLNPLGAIVAIGFTGGLWPDPSVQWLVGRNVAVVGVYLGRLMKLRPGFVRECAAELLGLWAQGEIDPVVGATFPLAARRTSARADRVAQARREGRPRAVKALVTGGEGGLGRAMRARLEREGYEVESLDLVDGFDVTDPAAWEQVGAVDLALPERGRSSRPRPTCAKLTDEEYRRAVAVNVDGVVLRRPPARAGDGRRRDRRDGVARRPRRHAARRDLLAHEARRRRLRAQRRAADRPDQDQRDLSGHRRHADARHARPARTVRGGRVPAAARPTRSPTRCGSPRRARGPASAGSSSRAASRRRSASRTSPARGGAGETVGLPPNL